MTLLIQFHYFCFRYILVLYSDRGLVKKGEFNHLFNFLYILFVTILSIWSVGLLFSYKLRGIQPVFLQICQDIDVEKLSFGGMVYVGTVLRIFFFICAMFMGFRVNRYVKSKSKDGKIPSKYGRYQRNILTLNHCFILGFFTTLNAVRLPLSHYMNNNTDIGVRQFILLTNLLVINLFNDVIFPTLVLINLSYSMPEFYSPNSRPKKKTFYVTQPAILPRRNDDTKISSNQPDIGSPPPLPLRKVIYVANKKTEETIPPFKIHKNLVSTTYVDDKGETVYMKYLPSVE